MAVEYSLLMQKTKDGSTVKSSLADFGFAMCDIQWPGEESQDVAVREWPGEHGEDAYIPPSGLKLKAYDLNVKLSYRGKPNTATPKFNALRSYLIGAAGDGAELQIFDPYWRKGRKAVYFKSIEIDESFKTNADEGLSVKLTFRVTDPISEITLNYVGD